MSSTSSSSLSAAAAAASLICSIASQSVYQLLLSCHHTLLLPIIRPKHAVLCCAALRRVPHCTMHARVRTWRLLLEASSAVKDALHTPRQLETYKEATSSSELCYHAPAHCVRALPSAMHDTCAVSNPNQQTNQCHPHRAVCARPHLCGLAAARCAADDQHVAGGSSRQQLGALGGRGQRGTRGAHGGVGGVGLEGWGGGGGGAGIMRGGARGRGEMRWGRGWGVCLE